MSDYTPTTTQVRAHYVGSDAYSAVRYDEFDRWLNSERAKAWDEGWDSRVEGLTDLPDNPYRSES
jgi:hypothetical protein